MNLVNTCPDIPDNWRGGMSEVSRVLGINRETLRRYVVMGRKKGGIDHMPGKNGRKLFTGREVKRFWYSF